MKRSFDETARARYEDALRHEGRAGASQKLGARHISRRQAEHPELEGDAAHRSSYISQPSFESRLGKRAEKSSALAGEDSGAERLAASRQRKSQQKMRATALLMVIPTLAASVMLMAMAHVVFRDWRSYESEASIARAQLNGLQEQLDLGQRRLQSLQSSKGREQILAEHGYIRPGDRLLLFPQEGSPESSASRAQSDIAARRGAIHNAASSSAWDRAARTVTGWLGSLSGSETPAPAPSTPASTSSNSRAPAPAVERAEEEKGEAISPEDRIVAPRQEAS